MAKLFMNLIKPFVDLLQNTLREGLISSAYNVFFFEKLLNIENHTLYLINSYILAISISLLSCKLLYKLFNIYILGIDGDNTTSPIEYFKSFVKGIVVSISFTVFYTLLSDICVEVAKKISGIIGLQTWETAWTALPLPILIFFLIYLCVAIYFYITFLIVGMRMLFLRVAIPLSCVGLIDNDNGIYASFIKKLMQTAITAVAQICIVQFSLIPLNAGASDPLLPYILAIAILLFGIKLTSDLNEIFIASPSSGAGQKLSAIGQGVSTVTNMLRRGK